MNNVFLIHGSIGKPFENWFPWLEEELSTNSIPCTIPSFPTPEHQDYNDWERLMDYYVELGTVNKDTVLVGHSCGSVFLVHYLLKKKIKVSAVICFSGYNNYISGYEFMDKLNRSFYMNSNTIDITPYADKVFAFYGDDDPNIPQEFLSSFAANIGAQKVKCVKGAGHFNATAGYTKCALALETIMSI